MKTLVLQSPSKRLSPRAPYPEPHITVNGQRLAAADKFVYLGSILSLCIILLCIMKKWPTESQELEVPSED